MYIQIYEYLNKILSKWQCRFHQSYNAHHCLFVIAVKWRQCLNNGRVRGALLTDLSKAFDCSYISYMTFQLQNLKFIWDFKPFLNLIYINIIQI